jgi:hypothetical protein
MGVGGQRHDLDALPPGRRPGTIVQEAGTQGRFGRVQKMSPPTGMRSSDRPSRSGSLDNAVAAHWL